jgi:two-component system LytT family response regulator
MDRRLVVKSEGRVIFLKMDEIDWIEAAGDYASLHVGSRTHLLRETLNSLEARLDPARFVRIHRSTIVQAARIRELDALPNRELRIRLVDGKELKVSRSYRDHLDRWLR